MYASEESESGARNARRAKVMVVRFADDNVLGFQCKADADRFIIDFQDRLKKF